MTCIFDPLNQRTPYAGCTERWETTKKLQKWYIQIKRSRIKGPRKIFGTQNEAESACMMNIDVKSWQVKCVSSN